jgi:UDP-N-acetyl-D-glucosamine dehydrogenase
MGGLQVLGFDTDASKVERLNRGESYRKHIASSRLAAWPTPWEGAGGFAATNDLSRIAGC